MDEGDCGEVEGRGKQTGLRSRCERASLLSLWEWAPLVLRMTSVLQLRNVCRVFFILPLKLSPRPPPFSQEHSLVGNHQRGSEDDFFLFSSFFDLGKIQNTRETQEHCWFYLIE